MNTERDDLAVFLERLPQLKSMDNCVFSNVYSVEFYKTGIQDGDWFGHYVEQQMPFAGIGNIEYVGHQFVATQLQAQERIGMNSYVLLRVAAAQQTDKLRNLLDNRTILGMQAAYYYNTLFGPIGATLGYSNRSKKPYFFLNLGCEF